ncbi:MAG: 50S ribosomal protein L11 methyltransferase [Aquificaceae bacterium]|nr:50S ribosomal protein L11 methyltransferase [Aquificaceae bacterium]
MKKLTKRVYKLPLEEFYSYLANYKVPLEILSSGEETIEFASYEELPELKPISVLDVEIGPPPSKSILRVDSFLILSPDYTPLIIRRSCAFGTGLHESTQVSLKLLKRALKSGMSVLDVGTGSGILAISAKLLGASKVVAIDIDPCAIKECKENSALNRVNIDCILASPSEIDETFDLVIANLELSIFEKELKNILPLFSSKGIFSGLYTKRELLNFIALAGSLKLEAKMSRRSWFGVILKK